MNSEKIRRAIEGVIAREGGYVDHPADRGGPTRYGITERTARRAPWHYAGVMAALPIDLARQIYRADYVNGPGFADVIPISLAVAEELVDTGVLMGPGTACNFLQRALNVFNLQGEAYPDIAVDGGCGPQTRSALQSYLRARGVTGERVLVRLLNSLQGVRLVEIAENDPRQEAFVFGQVAHRA